MARYRYRPYRSRRRKSHNLWWSLLALIVIVCGAIILHKSRGNGDIVDEPLESEMVGLVEPEPEFEPVHYEPLAPAPAEEDEEQPLVEPDEYPEKEPERAPVESGAIANPETIALIMEAQDDIASGRIISARDKLNHILLTMQLNSADRIAVKSQLAKLSRKWLFSRAPYPEDPLTGVYEVRSGDLFSEIGKNYKVPYRILMAINNISRPEQLRAGGKIKVINGPFHAIVYRSTFTMDLYLGHKTYVKTYRIGLGEESKETPTGKWRVKKGGKLIKPTWRDPETGRTYVADDPDYPLGSRWIGLDGLEGSAKGRTGFAIHGTKEPKTIGTRSSRGCIRLFNGDAIELYNLLVEGLSEVRVVD